MHTDTSIPSTSTVTCLDDMSTFDRIRRGLDALGKLQKNPGTTELALTAAISLNFGQLRRQIARYETQPELQDLLRLRPAIDIEHVDLAALARLPEGTLGRSYTDFLKARGLTPDVFTAPAELRDERVRYVAQRLRQTHDLWHVLTGYNTDVPGELELQAFMYGQLQTPFSLLTAIFGSLQLLPHSPRILARLWAAYRRGRRAEPLAWRFWERCFATPVSELRRQLRLAA